MASFAPMTAAQSHLVPVSGEEPRIAARETSSSPSVTFSAFYDENLEFVWRNFGHMLGFDSIVDDVVQEVFMVALRRLPEFEGRSSARTWLYGILRRVVSDHRRAIQRRKVRDSVDLDEIATRDSGPHRTAEKAERLQILYEMLDKLDENKREVFILAEIERMSAPQIAEAIGINATTVHARLRDARRELDVMVQRFRARGGRHVKEGA
jgi:RNA polymerase sigma-70 factor (ECF subfamily)